jgi:preprotein translocase subunit SecG
VWQGIGAILTFLAIVVPLFSAVTFSANRLVIAPINQFKTWQMLDAQHLTDDRIKITLDGVSVPSQELLTVTYVIWNRSENAIVPADYFENIVATPMHGVTVLATERVKSIDAVDFVPVPHASDWKKTPDGAFELRSQLINPGKFVAYDFLLWIPGLDAAQQDFQQRLEFSGRVKNVDVITYGTEAEGESSSDLTGWGAHIEGLTTLAGVGIFSVLDIRQVITLFASAALLIFIHYLLLRVGGIVPRFNLISIVAVTLGVVLSISTAEALVGCFGASSYYFSSRGTPPFIYYPIFSLQILYLLILVFVVYKRTKGDVKVFVDTNTTINAESSQSKN